MSGFLEVGTNDAHEVIVNLPHDMTGHIVFSPAEARQLADTLVKKARDAEQAQHKAAEAERIAAVPPVDRSNICTTSGEPVAVVRANQTEETGQHRGYIVLCPEERAKGFVRPYRDAYKHLTCGSVTTMGRALSETYARDFTFYSATFCVKCNAHFSVGESGEFVWIEPDGCEGAKVGT